MAVPAGIPEPGRTADHVGEIRDRFALADLADRYLLCLDEQTFGETVARSVFTEDAAFFFPVGNHQGIAGVADFTRGFMACWALTQHLCSNYSIEVRGETATMGWNVIATHVRHGSAPPASDHHFQVGGRFQAAAVRTAHGWRIRELTLRIAWITGQGNPSVAVAMTSSPALAGEQITDGERHVMSTTDVASADVQRSVVDKIWLEGLNKGDLSAADDYLTADFRNHGSHDDSITGPEAFKLTIRKQRSGFSDIKYEILDFVSQGDRCAVRWVMRGRHTGEFLGVPPTGREVEHHAVLILRFEGDKIAERWGVVDNYALLRFLQASG